MRVQRIWRIVVTLALVALALGPGSSGAAQVADGCLYVIDAQTRDVALAELAEWLYVLQDGDLTGQRRHIDSVTYLLDELSAATPLCFGKAAGRGMVK